MRKAKEYSKELIESYNEAHSKNDMKIFGTAWSKCLVTIISKELYELRDARNIKTDNGLIPIFKELRNKYVSICNQVNLGLQKTVMNIGTFDESVGELMPNIYDWYKENVIK